MIQRLKNLLFVVLLLITLNGCTENTAPICIEFSPSEETTADYSALLLNRLSTLSQRDNIVIKFAKGTYHFYPDKATGKYLAITNHDNGYRYFAFPLIGMSNVRIDGGGAEFIFHGKIIPFFIENSTNIHLTNFHIDWQVPFYLQGNVIASNSRTNEVDIAIPSEFQYGFVNNRLYPSGEGWKEYLLGENIVFDSKTQAVAYRTEFYYLGDRVHVTQLAERCFRIQSNFTQKPPEKGMIMTFKGEFGSNRHSPAICINSSRSIQLDSIDIYHCGGMGVVAEKSQDIHLDGVNVKLREGSSRILSSMADATHFCNCRGELLVENCLFENMLDDAINVHGTYIRITSVVSNKMVVARTNHPQQADYNFCAAGDSIQLINNNTLLPCGIVTVEKMRRINESYVEISFQQPLPNTAHVGTGLENISWYPRFTFRNNVVRNNRARSLLVSIPTEVLIENNTFSSMMSAILLEGDMNNWFESGAVKQVTIRGNQFLDGTYGGENYPTLSINPQQRLHVADSTYESNITIEGNLFKTFNKSLIRANSVDHLIIRGNHFEKSDTYKPWLEDVTISLRNSKRIVIGGNVNKLGYKLTLRMDSVTRHSEHNISEDIEQIATE